MSQYRYCNLCGSKFELNPRIGILWAEKTNRGRYCSDKCSRTSRRGVRVSKITEFKRGSDPTLHWNWRGGKTKTILGYIQIYKPDHPGSNSRGYVFEHRLVMEESLGRYLTKKEVVHHINHNKQDNSINNLQLFGSQSEHIKFEGAHR